MFVIALLGCLLGLFATAALVVAQLPPVADRLAQHLADRASIELDGSTWDFVVVGAGSAGSVLTKRLSENPNIKVLVLEAGVSDNDMLIQIPAASPNLFGTSRVWNYFTKSMPGINGRQQFCPRGKMIGGTGSLNLEIYNRGMPQDYDNWALQLRDPSWSYNRLLPLFKRTEHNLGRNISVAAHGFDGEWKISDQFYLFNTVPQVRQAWLDQGFSDEPDTNAGYGHPTGFSVLQGNMNNGQRFSTADAMMTPDVLARQNLYVRPQAHVTRVVFEDDRAVAVEFKDLVSGATKRVNIGKEVVLSAGVINSPQLLQLSGVGPRDLLQQFGIDVVRHVPGVGENLQDHTQAGVTMFANPGVETFETINNQTVPEGQIYSPFVVNLVNWM